MAFELANETQTKELNHLLYSKEISNADKVKQVTAIYNTLGVKELAIREANKHTDIALKHLEELNADASKKNDLKELAKKVSVINCPVYLLHGDADKLVPVSNAAYGKKIFINASPLHVSILPGAHHHISDDHYELVKQLLMNLEPGSVEIKKLLVKICTLYLRKILLSPY